MPETKSFGQQVLGALPMVGGILDAGIGLFNSAQARKAQERANADAKAFAISQYNTQRKDSLADWNMQNAYNSPDAQMARFKAAGLNPNLIYGQTNTAQPVRSSTPGSYAPKAASLAIPQNNIMGGIYQAKEFMMNQEISKQILLNKKQELINMGTKNLAMQQGMSFQNMTMEQKKELFPLVKSGQYLQQKILGQTFDQREGLYPINKDIQTQKLEMGKLAMAQKSQDIVQSAERHKADLSKIASDIRSQAQGIKESKARTSLIGAQEDHEIIKSNLSINQMHVTALDAKLAKAGIRPGDPRYYEAASQLFGPDNIGYFSLGEAGLNKLLEVVDDIIAVYGKNPKKKVGRVSDTKTMLDKYNRDRAAGKYD